ncbi:MAG TPA: uracil phosphoribosyltransferase [Parachlamydiales bacterium]|nr:uracil phosphoribosyltransferase [Parachlamydiales bacterium]
MKDDFLTTLRDRETKTEGFRKAAHQLSGLLAAESSSFLPKMSSLVNSPMASAEGSKLKREPVLVSILRSGLVLLPAFVSLYPGASIGCVGIRRDEKTAAPHLYSSHLPQLRSDDMIFLLDPMVATGQSAELAIRLIKEAGGSEAKIMLVSFLASSKGMAYVKRKAPDVHALIAHVDEGLDANHWIIPGLGDFGDRYFET